MMEFGAASRSKRARTSVSTGWVKASGRMPARRADLRMCSSYMLSLRGIGPYWRTNRIHLTAGLWFMVSLPLAPRSYSHSVILEAGGGAAAVPSSHMADETAILFPVLVLVGTAEDV